MSDHIFLLLAVAVFGGSTYLIYRWMREERQLGIWLSFIEHKAYNREQKPIAFKIRLAMWWLIIAFAAAITFLLTIILIDGQTP